MVFHIYCTSCSEAGEYQSESASKSDGWSAVETTGVSGPSTTEGRGVCPDCHD